MDHETILNLVNDHPLYSGDDNEDSDRPVLFKIGIENLYQTWYILEGEISGDGDWLFFGVHSSNGDWEYTEFTDSEINELGKINNSEIWVDTTVKSTLADIKQVLS